MTPVLSRFRGALALAATALAVALPAHGVPARHDLTFTASRSATTVWDLRSTVTLDPGLAFDCDDASYAVKLGGKYLGVDIRTSAGTQVLQLWAVRGMGTYDVGRETSPCMSLYGWHGWDGVRIPPGRYLVSVLTDGPSSLTFRAVPGLTRTTTLHPTKPAPRADTFWSQSRELHPSSTTRFHAKRGGWGLVIADLRSPHAIASNISLCVRPAEEACDDLDNNGSFTTTGAGETTTWEPVRPGWLTPGAYKAWYSTLTVDISRESTFFTYFSTYS